MLLPKNDIAIRMLAMNREQNRCITKKSRYVLLYLYLYPDSFPPITKSLSTPIINLDSVLLENFAPSGTTRRWYSGSAHI